MKLEVCVCVFVDVCDILWGKEGNTLFLCGYLQMYMCTEAGDMSIGVCVGGNGITGVCCEKC